MRSLLRWAVFSLVGVFLCCLLSAVVFDALIVQPVLAKIEATIAGAAPSERTPPGPVVEMLHRAYGGRLKFLVARDALATSPSQIEGASQLRRQFTELGVGLLLPLHCPDVEVAAAFLSGTYMGPGVRGFALASDRYLGVPLGTVTLAQAAKLVAIAHAPSAYLESPERLERRTQHLLSLRLQ